MWWIDFCLSSSGPTALSNLAPSKSFRGFQDGTSGKEPTCQSWRHKSCGFEPWVGKIPWRRKQQPTPVFLSGESHGQNSLVGYSLWDHRVGHNWSNLTHTKAFDLSYDTLPITLLILATWPLVPLTEKHVQRINSPKVSFIHSFYKYLLKSLRHAINFSMLCDSLVNKINITGLTGFVF